MTSQPLPLEGYTAMQTVAQHAEEVRPNFAEDARTFVLQYLREWGPTSGEWLTLRCKAAGIRAHDDRAMGSVFYSLSRRGLIVKVGTAVRKRGHGTAGANIWDLACR